MSHLIHNPEFPPESFNNGRYLLFLDILGFSNLVKERNPEELYSIIDSSLKTLARWEKLNKQFKTIYFSDSFIFYQDVGGYGDWAFLDIYAIGALILSSLLSNKIAARGAIAFGEFIVKNDFQNNHQIFYGKALVEAYEAEQKEQWIGITIQPSAWEPFELTNGSITVLEKERVFRRRKDGVLLLNPFIKIRYWYYDDLIGEINSPYMEWDRPDFPNEILAFKFIHDEVKDLIMNGRFSDKDAIKYHATLSFIKDILGEDIYNWAKKISESV